MLRDRNLVEKVLASLKNIGNFEVEPLRESEEGGCYKAVDAGRRIAVGIRTIWPHNDEHLQHLLTQARAAQSIDQSNICKVIGSGELDDCFFIVSSFANGNTLRQQIAKTEHLNPWDLIDFARQACVGLESAHARGVIHCALHPDNVVLEFDGSTKLLDVGVYRGNDGSRDPFFPNAVYLAPEQFEGEAPGRATNFYGIAVMLYEIATLGKLPYTGGTWAELASNSKLPFPEPISLNSSLPPGINAVLVKALSRDPAGRYTTGPELVRALEDFKSFNRPTPPAPVVAPSVAPRPIISTGSAAAVAPAPVRNPFASVPEAVPAAEPQLELFSVQASPTAEKTALPPTQQAVPAPPMPEASPEPEVAPARPAAPVRRRRPSAVEQVWARVRKADPWIFAIVVLVLVVAGFIYRSISMSFSGTPKVEQTYEAPQPSPTPAQAPVEATQAPAPVVNETPAATQPEPAQSIPAEFLRTARHAAGKAPQRGRAAAKPLPLVDPNTTGSVMVTSVPAGARVTIDGKTDQTFTTPQLIASLPQGMHTLSFSKDGYSPATRSLQITAGTKANVSVQLDIPTGFITVLSNPPSAFIIIDGTNTGRVTPSQVPIAPGLHTITLRKMGYLEANDSFSVQAGQQQSKNLNLLESGSTPDIRVVPTGKLKFFSSKVSGTKVTVRTSPPGATVFINGQSVTKNTPVDFALNPGNYVMELHLNGYQTVQKTISVETGKPLAFDEPLHP